MQVPRGGQAFSSEPVQNPPVGGYLGGTDAANAPDRERQETVRQNLGVRDAAGLALGQRLPLTSPGAEGPPAMRCTKEEKKKKKKKR